jgi:hypothetical protein
MRNILETKNRYYSFPDPASGSLQLKRVAENTLLPHNSLGWRRTVYLKPAAPAFKSSS